MVFKTGAWMGGLRLYMVVGTEGVELVAQRDSLVGEQTQGQKQNRWAGQRQWKVKGVLAKQDHYRT